MGLFHFVIYFKICSHFQDVSEQLLVLVRSPLRLGFLELYPSIFAQESSHDKRSTLALNIEFLI